MTTVVQIMHAQYPIHALCNAHEPVYISCQDPRTIAINSWLLHFLLFVYLIFYCLIALLALPIYNFVSNSLYHYLFFLLNDLCLEHDPYQQESFRKSLATACIRISPYLRIYDTPYYEGYGNAPSCPSKCDVLLCASFPRGWSSFGWSLPFVGSHSFWYSICEDLLCTPLWQYRNRKHSSSNYFGLFGHSKKLLSAVRRLFRLNPLSFPCLLFYADTRYERPRIFNRDHGAFLQSMNAATLSNT